MQIEEEVDFKDLQAEVLGEEELGLHRLLLTFISRTGEDRILVFSRGLGIRLISRMIGINCHLLVEVFRIGHLLVEVVAEAVV